MMRRLAVVTAIHTHRRLHGQVRGHMVLRPAAERAADPGPPAPVADDLTEQTVSADDAMTVEERGGGAAVAGTGVVGQSGGEDGSPVATTGGAAAASVVADWSG